VGFEAPKRPELDRRLFATREKPLEHGRRHLLGRGVQVRDRAGRNNDDEPNQGARDANMLAHMAISSATQKKGRSLAPTRCQKHGS
jgi:hypothetical protein